jgi:hypothetical protein
MGLSAQKRIHICAFVCLPVLLIKGRTRLALRANNFRLRLYTCTSIKTCLLKSSGISGSLFLYRSIISFVDGKLNKGIIGNYGWCDHLIMFLMDLLYNLFTVYVMINRYHNPQLSDSIISTYIHKTAGTLYHSASVGLLQHWDGYQFRWLNRM